MKKIFKSKKSNKIKIKKILILLIISFFSAYVLSKIDILKNKNIINYLKNTSLNKITTKKIKLKGENLIKIGLSTFDNITFSKEVTKQQEIKKDEKNPRIYIYNTHQTEEYRTIENYNLTPTVLTAALILKDKLNDYKINSIVETSNLKEEMNRLGYNYNQTYKISRMWLEKLNKNDLDLYIDLHRDSITYNYSNITIDNKDYAKIMFVIGTGYNYEENMNVANKLLENIELINKEISRGLFIRENSIYNADFNKNCVLIELGGPESTYTSISNSLDVLSLAIKNYLGE